MNRGGQGGDLRKVADAGLVGKIADIGTATIPESLVNCQPVGRGRRGSFEVFAHYPHPFGRGIGLERFEGANRALQCGCITCRCFTGHDPYMAGAEGGSGINPVLDLDDIGGVVGLRNIEGVNQNTKNLDVRINCSGFEGLQIGVIGARDVEVADFDRRNPRFLDAGRHGEQIETAIAEVGVDAPGSEGDALHDYSVFCIKNIRGGGEPAPYTMVLG